ncbi:hypothetical protein A3K29_03455 [Candidatus Collierbacteria bacterium RIFOXYB2_FULL_46_14]|uniref:O-antigen ligase-related domain-containing protein n=1 Tax=Candidatus Collierbacteria bacterium GW2011_GWA2_46_26 TaxID=1618381 RepID=A0A0G1PM50_9BACT|nr:MAG: hypothetical protein UW29_C0004G0198 [Candidatus Collierbacteria bacterium GW2011_GWC2_44_13]KKU33752.1 MAG: hypothetical protein UX47_C0001G0035 [Candidatus Collierbacteria bacterium GW2011_GWA2_46_26]OGD73175.1 MAG: hypothetical protein A3K29_03455 [Candidatus Collierbacteria bacterium RIFOXYB2_FULL_46_14]OGD76217.1 MAG: hypothetical protein A3K43_03455 [Candidatus Collierbacteria bacterium RIFOXYA2_FULL_46_20]OGD77553.1 MAG: hypothetical protein A3K39_03455 [Candidatus Collierbacteri
MTYFLLILSLFAWPFGQLLAFSVPGFSINIYLLDLLVGLLTISLVLSPLAWKKVASDTLFRPLMYFNLIAGLSLLVNLQTLITSATAHSILYLARLFAYPSVYFAAKLFPPKKTISPVIFSFILFCILGVLQYLRFPDMRYLKLVGFDDHYFRLIGSLYDPNFTGAILAAASLFFIALSNWAASLPLIVLLALTFSRASYLSFALGMVYLLVKDKKYPLILFLVGLTILVWLIPKPFGEGVNLFRTFSIFSRLDSWESGMSLFVQKPLFGWGYNTLRDLTGSRFQIDNSYLYVAVTTGLLGLVFYIRLLMKCLRGLLLPKKVFLYVLFIHSLFNNSLFFIWINFAFWIVLALPVREYKED